MSGFRLGRRVATQGFTLMEVAIVLIVIGLLVGGVVAGRAIIQSAELNTVVSDTRDFADAINKFEESYGGLPGDLVNASSFFTGATNGNGNGRIDGAEGLQTWRHLALAGLIPGSYDGASNALTTGVPPTRLARASGFLAVHREGMGLSFELTGFNGTTSGLAAISGEDALSLDRKYDDGDPTTGNIRAADGSDTPGQCIVGAAYNAGVKTPVCQLIMLASANRENTTQTYNTPTCGANQLGATRTASSACPVGFVGRKVETCQRDGTWKLSHDYCRPANCGGGIYNDTKQVACPPGFTGDQTMVCSAQGVWKIQTDACAEDVSGACTPGANRTVACPLGKTGKLVQTCNAMGTGWVNNAGDDCNTDITCPGGQSPGQTRNSSTTCPTNMTGTITETCTMVGQWLVTSNSCTGATGCSTGATSTQSCPTGQTGQVTLTCMAGSPNIWMETSTTCAAANCDGQPIGAMRSGNAPCPSGMVGTLYDICLETGQWSPSTAYCATIGCHAETSGNAIWASTAAGATATGTCLSGYSGTPTRSCSASAIWGPVSNPCSADLCDTGDSGGTNTAILGSATLFKILSGALGADFIGCFKN